MWAHGLGGFSPSLVGPIAFGPVVRQNVMVETKLTHLVTIKQKRERR